jgi:hypothetical protein
LASFTTDRVCGSRVGLDVSETDRLEVIDSKGHLNRTKLPGSTRDGEH